MTKPFYQQGTLFTLSWEYCSTLTVDGYIRKEGNDIYNVTSLVFPCCPYLGFDHNKYHISIMYNSCMVSLMTWMEESRRGGEFFGIARMQQPMVEHNTVILATKDTIGYNMESINTIYLTFFIKGKYNMVITVAR